MKDRNSNPICLIRPEEEGGGAYCNGNVCFGMGAKGTHDLTKATCSACKKKYYAEVRENIWRRHDEE